jgi:hypothetical protein
VSFNVGNTVIDGGATRPGEVVDHAKLARLTLALNNTKRRTTEFGEGWGREGTSSSALRDQGGHRVRQELTVLLSRLEILDRLTEFRAGKSNIATEINYLEYR